MTIAHRIMRLRLGDGLSAPQISERLCTYQDGYEHRRTCAAIVELVEAGKLENVRETIAEVTASVFRRPR